MSVGEIPGVVFIGVGLLVSVISFFLAFLRKQNTNFFIITLIVGVLMIIYGIIKVRVMRRNTDEEVERRRAQREYSRMQQSAQPQQVQQGGAFERATHPSQYQTHPHQTTHYTHQGHSQPSEHHTMHQTQHAKKFCPNCGSPVHGHHRFCSSCGGKL